MEERGGEGEWIGAGRGGRDEQGERPITGKWEGNCKVWGEGERGEEDGGSGRTH